VEICKFKKKIRKLGNVGENWKNKKKHKEKGNMGETLRKKGN
jgi:hypothetical protein